MTYRWTKQRLETERMAYVFGLTGGELADKPWSKRAWWYEGIPDYVGDDFPDRYSSDVEYRTTLECCLYEPAIEANAPRGWKFVRYYTTSGETDCGWCGDGTGNEGQRDKCKLCEGDGLIYIGDGWAEVVYSRKAKE